MKSFAIVVAVLMLFAATAAAGDLAVSKSTLDGMGLADMQLLSDQDGMAVRGKGFIDDFLSSLLPDLSINLPGADDTPSNPQPDSPFGNSPFDKSFLNSFQGGSDQFGSGPSLLGNSFNFGSSAPWSQ